jgi:hypothetical protein
MHNPFKPSTVDLTSKTLGMSGAIAETIWAMQALEAITLIFGLPMY